MGTLEWLKTQKEYRLDQWLFCEDKWLFREACKGGHLERLKWLRGEGCTWDDGTSSWAAQSGHLEALKWLRSEGCPWNVYTCSSAAEGGHLEVLKWLRSEGCPWDEGA